MRPSILFCFVGLGAALHLLPPRPTKIFELTLTWGTEAPDGVERQQALINGQFPGPPLIFDEGDNVEVTVNNLLPFNTTMHWHGIECADSILINGKGRVRCVDSAYLTTLTPAPLVPLLQGKNYTDKGCLPVQNTYAQTTFSQHNYTAIPPSMFDECSATESIEEVVRVDPRKGWALTLSNGARYSVLVQLNNTPGNYLITAANAGLNQKIAGYGAFSYVNGDPSVVGKPSIDYAGNNMSAEVVVFDENKIKPLIPSRPREEADQTYVLTIGRIEKAWKWSLNGQHSYGLSLESEKPMLWDPLSYANSDLVMATKNDTWVDIVFAVPGNASTLQPGHPIHKHSNMVYVLGAGMGEFKWTSVAEAQREIPEMFNLVDPPMRDTFTTLPALLSPSWLAVRYYGRPSYRFLFHSLPPFSLCFSKKKRLTCIIVQNPGFRLTNQAFFLHCHIDPHLTGGMALAILDGIDAWPRIPEQYGPKGHWGKAT
ncbi:uncharacterized protein N7500_003107 [Penicillium coprophilum]|uniref:uncharacterized protein n=1 Tax=Penicillium coprophilum TaxID=36646 RepID=UPI0023898060|nr:uncharacterized protein N7500_003107 [Penicillium coprophilum]KAJ5170324.1 hypothetical protein N7500_003107 [Penicillium coprophilum]